MIIRVVFAVKRPDNPRNSCCSLDFLIFRLFSAIAASYLARSMGSATSFGRNTLRKPEIGGNGGRK